MTVDVYKAGVLAGQLRKVPGGTEFSYLPDYLASDGPPVATSLPKTAEPVRHTGGAIPPFFAGLLPEGRRLSVLRREIKASADDELALLLAVGQDTVGDVQVTLHGQQLQTPDPMLRIPAEGTAALSVREMLTERSYDGIAIPGVQDKLSGRVINMSGSSAGQLLIVKLDPPEYPLVTANEAAFLNLAGNAGLQVPGYALHHDRDGTPLLLIDRFDRHHTAGGVRLLAAEDATQVLSLWPADKYSVSYETVVNALAPLCAAEAVARLELFRQIVFAWLTGNGDLHAKNLSILEDPDTGEWRISPAYDLPSTVPYGDLTMALTMGGGTEGLSRRRLLQFAADIGIRPAAAERALDTLLDRTAPVLTDLQSLQLPYGPKTVADWQKQLNWRRKQALA